RHLCSLRNQRQQRCAVSRICCALRRRCVSGSGADGATETLFRRTARRFRSVKEIKMLRGFLIICDSPITAKCKLVSAIFCPFLIFLMGMAMTRNLEAEEAGSPRLIQAIPLHNVEGRIDHMAVGR